jgi:hypothetical protein
MEIMSEKVVIICDDERKVEFAVSKDSPKSEIEVRIAVFSDKTSVMATCIFDEEENPKICAALAILRDAMLEEGGEECEVVQIG